MNEQTIAFEGSDIRLLSDGSGDPLLYVHGSGDAGAWIPAQGELARGYAVYRPDIPGYNGSPAREDAATVPAIAALLWRLVDELGLGTLRIVGSSLGGWISAQMAVTQPGRVSHLVLMDAVGLPVPGGNRVDQFTMSPAEVMQAIYHLPALREQVSAATAERLKDPAAAERMRGNGATTALLGRDPYFHDPALAGRLPSITAKTLVLWGADDGLVPVEVGRLYADAIPGARLEIIPECGHLPLVERTDEALAIITPFLAG
jgi:pimeloyl-ACP methyl ester carboxylesterase